MDPEYKRYLPALYIVGGIILFILLISWLISPKYGSYQLHKTSFTSNHFVSINGDKLYAYSGAGFYRVSPSDPTDISVLSSGLRLPEVKKLVWAGDRGALIVFGDAQSDTSEVTKELAAIGQTLDITTQEYVWYIDFKTNKLSLVNTAPLSWESVYYSTPKQGFYFSAHSEEGAHGEDHETLSPLSFFSVVSKKTQTVIDDVGHERVGHIGGCLNNEVCVVQDTMQGKQVLWRVENGSKKTIINSYDKILPTNDPFIFITEKNQPIETGEENEDVMGEAVVSVFNLASGKATETDLLVSVGANVITSSSNNGKKLAIIDGSQRAEGNTQLYSAVASDIFGNMKSKESVLTLDNNDEISDDFLTVSSTSREGVVVLAGSSGGVYVLAPPSYTIKSDKYNGNRLETALKPCFTKYTKYHKYTSEISEMMVGVVYDDKFQQNVGNFSKCIDNTDKRAFVGQSYTFVGLSPIDGRFVTN